VVVGLPISMGGGMGPAARAATAEAEALATVLPVPVETFDERLTTVAADRLLLAGRVKGGARRRVVDKIAAAVLLQSWLEKQSS
jgi:putative Holliday junction resolvase